MLLEKIEDSKERLYFLGYYDLLAMDSEGHTSKTAFTLENFKTSIHRPEVYFLIHLKPRK